MDTTRRTFLQGAAVGATLVPALTPGTAAASLGEGSARIHEQLRVFRGREDAIRREYLEIMAVTGGEGELISRPAGGEPRVHRLSRGQILMLRHKPALAAGACAAGGHGP